jgi:uncharacterized protein
MQNSVVWSEIAVSDLKRAAAFYEKLLDTELAFDKFGPFRIALFPHGEQGVGGCLMHGEGYEPSGKGTVTYLAATPGIDAALERARAAGGKILMPKTQLPGNQGWIAHVQDCEGNRIGLHAMS